MQNFAGLKVKENVNGFVRRQLPLSIVWSFSQTVNHRCVYKTRICAVISSATTGRAHLLPPSPRDRFPAPASVRALVGDYTTGWARRHTAPAPCLWEGAGRHRGQPGNQSCRPPRLSFPLDRSREPDAQLSVCRAGACLEGAGILSLWQGGCPAGSSVGPDLLPSLRSTQPWLCTCCFFGRSCCLPACCSVRPG